MIRWPLSRLIVAGALVLATQAAIVLFLIPQVSGYVATSINQDRYTDGYDQLAENLVTGNGYRFYPDTAKTLMREPGYPLLLAGLMLTVGNSFTAVKLANVVMALITAWVMMQLTRRVLPSKGRRSELLVWLPALLFLFHPGILVAESRGGVEIVFSLLITTFMLTTYEAIEKNRWWNYAVGGTVLGVTLLFRSTPMLFPFFLLVYLLLFERERVSIFSMFRNVTIMVFAMFAILSPWILRNYSLTGKIVPTASVLGVSAQAGQYIGTHLWEGKPIWLLDREAARLRDKVAIDLGYSFKEGPGGYYQTFYRSVDEVTFSKALFGRVKGEYLRHPMLFLRCLAQNVVNFWVAGKTWSATAINLVIQIPYLAFAFFGVWKAHRNCRMKSVAPILLFIGYVMAVHVPILAQARYSIPMLPLVSILAMLGIATSVQKVLAWKDASDSASVVVAQG